MYKKSIKLEDNEIPARINVETGEISHVRELFNSLPEGKEVWMKDATFTKMFSYSWSYLTRTLNSDELKVLVILTLMADPGTNALPPLNDAISMSQLQEYFGIYREKIPKILKSLFEIGVYAKFEVSNIDEPFKQYWILNPYVSFKGRLADSSIMPLFYNTKVEREYVKQFMLERGKKPIVLSKSNVV